MLINVVSKRKLDFDENRILLSLHLTIKTEDHLILSQAHSGIKSQMPVSYLQHALFLRHSQVSWHKTEHKGSRHTLASQQCKEKHVKTFDQLNHRCF